MPIYTYKFGKYIKACYIIYNITFTICTVKIIANDLPNSYN